MNNSDTYQGITSRMGEADATEGAGNKTTGADVGAVVGAAGSATADILGALGADNWFNSGGGVADGGTIGQESTTITQSQPQQQQQAPGFQFTPAMAMGGVVLLVLVIGLAVFLAARS